MSKYINKTLGEVCLDITGCVSSAFEGQRPNQQRSHYLYFSVGTRVKLHIHTLFTSDPEMKLGQIPGVSS